MLGGQLFDVTQLTFVCGPDQTFSEKSRGPSGIEWGQRFDLYKQTILRLPPSYYSFLLAWYDNKIFVEPDATSASAASPSTPQQHQDVDDLIWRMNNADVATLGRSLCPTAAPQSPSPSFQSAGSAVSQSLDAELTDQLQVQVPVSAPPEQDVPTDNAPTKKKSSKGKRTGINMPTDGAVRKTRSAKSRE
jgi:hypothetical protein